MQTFIQIVAFVAGMFAASNNPLPEDPRTTDDTWDCYTVDELGGQVYVCEHDIEPCHYKHDRERECTIVLRWRKE